MAEETEKLEVPTEQGSQSIYKKISEIQKHDVETPVEEFLNWRQRNPDQPLFLPPNSIRALIIVWLLVILSYLTYTGQVDTNAILQLLSLCVGFYFGTRSANSPPTK